MTSAYYSRMREIEGVEMVELVYVGTLLRMGGDSLLLPVWRSVRGGFKGKGESEVWVEGAEAGSLILRRGGRDRKPNFVACSA